MDILTTKNITENEFLIRKSIIGIKGIYDCQLRQKETKEGTTITILYILSTQIVEEDDIKSKIVELVDDEFKIVQLTGFPLTEDGELDNKDLTETPIFDEVYTELLAKKLTDEYPSLELKYSQKESFELESNKQISVSKQAIISGGVVANTVAENTLSESLVEASKNSDKGITLINNQGRTNTVTYGSLLENAKTVAGAFEELKIDRETPVIMQLPDMEQYIEVFWGGILKGIPMIPMAFPKQYTKSVPTASKLASVVNQFSKSIVVCNKDEIEVIESFLEENTNTLVKVIAYEEVINNTKKLNTFDVKPDDIAVYLMTSGSTGAPKLVPQTHRRLINRCAATIAANGFTKEEISLNWLPLDHVGGIIMFHVRDVVSKCSQIQVNTNYILQKPLRWMELCSQFKVNITWAPNFAFNLISSFTEEIAKSRLDLSMLRFIMNSGEQVVASQVHKFLKLFKPFKLSSRAVFPAWGMSETCSAVLFNKNFDLTLISNQYVSVGSPVPGIDVRIVNENNKLLKEGEHGKLQIKGATILDSYYKRPDVNKEAFTDDNWFDTGDIAFVENEEVAIVGRNKDILIINGQNLSCHEIEEYIDANIDVEPSSTAVVPYRNEGSFTDNVAVFYHTKKEGAASEKIEKTIRREVSILFGFTPSKIVRVEPNEIPRTSIGKIQKGKLTKMLEAGDFNTESSSSNTVSENNTYDTTVLEQTWKPKKLSKSIDIEPKTVLVFPQEESAINFEALPNDTNVVFALNSDSFHKISKNQYGLNQDCSEDFLKLLEDISLSNIQLDTIIIESREYKNEKDASIIAEKNALTLLHLAKALGKLQKKSLQLILVSKNNQQVLLNEVTKINAGSQIGMMHAIHEELKGISCKHIDLDSLTDVTLLINEAKTIHEFEREIAYRDTKRFVSKLSQAQGHNYAKSFIPQDNETYLITGGLGGIAIALAKSLLKRANVNLVLLGRSAFDTLNKEKLEEYKELTNMSSSITYLSADLNNYETLKQKLTEFNIDCIFHLAADFKMDALGNFSTEEFKHQIQTKVKGSFNLYNVASELEISNFINFSSLNGYFGGVGVIAYAGANSFQKALTSITTKQEKLKVWNISWSIWENTGLGKAIEFPELAARKGFDILKPENALNAMYNVLAKGISNSFIGVDKNNLFMQPYLSLKTSMYKQVEVFGSEDDLNTSFKKHLKDEFGTTIPVLKKVLAEDFTTSLNENTEDVVLNAGGIENYVTTVFEEVLKTDEFSKEDSFFDLGGNSLILPQVFNKIEEKYKCGLTIVDLFQHTTVQEISDLIGNKLANQEDKESYESVKEQVLAIWIKLLNLDEIDEEENLFDLGLNSLMIPQAQNEINELFNTELSVVDFFQYSSVSTLVEVICEKLQITN
ncbi:SDR family NAD(P)-dependent oxidoreductase [Tenacibaculum tangerinum]|uniref:SDR family NAD(P)-dependent oxidoreductase n=1 Tax=Tenacibaculum tangerinum TaxID=3038772 RepID=A0ABY8KYW9_9FLAO|nr:SDR family NAD(P)-dependent oxidoreductase [Tenacibaculum tangerinum]WGH74224.1 SDR family NAD(P)-dependent oxidoreductase [Tenacibaculum tangerinum]